MTLKFPAFALIALAAAAVQAQEAVYLCVNKDGSKEYKNTGDTKGCKKIEMEGLTVVPAPKRPAQAAARPSSSPSDFPRIDGNRQRLLDEERRQILLGEMQEEERKLAELLKAYNNGQPERQGNDPGYQQRVVALKEDINRVEKNIEALKRELDNLR